MIVPIFDIRFGTYIYHSTPNPTTETLLLAGYEKEQGNIPMLTTSPPEFSRYKRVYIVKDTEDLFYDPEWLKYGNVVLVGPGWAETEHNPEWEEALPDMEIYAQWIANWRERYPKFSANRLVKFYMKPHKLQQGKRIVLPKEESLIIDRHPEQNIEALSEIDKKHYLLNPLKIDGLWAEALEYFAQRVVVRNNFWARINLAEYDENSTQEAIEIYNSYKPGRMFRIKAYDFAKTDEEWIERLRFAYWFFGEFRMQSKKRLFYEPIGHEGLFIERVIKEYKRWCAKDMGYKKNSLFDYMLYDGMRTLDLVASVLYDPYEHTFRKRQGSNKFSQLIPIIETYPEVMDIITKSYPQGAS